MSILRSVALLLALLFSSTLIAQDKIIIEPGKGVGKLLIGMKYSKVKKLLGSPMSTETDEQERESFKNGGYEPDDFLVFRLGFDKCCTYGNNKQDYPVFKVYFKKGKVCYIVLSGASFGSVRAGIFVTADGLGFNSKKEDLLKSMGNAERYVKMANYDGEYGYDKKGISFVVENDGSIISMDIFPAK
jgi:hypothetical protein